MITGNPMRVIAIFTLSLLLASTGVANQDSPYAGQESRSIKALSQTQVQSYLQGRGMGYARAAELNRYPGPLHVLELADELELSPAQLEKTEALFDAMQAEASRLGAQLVERERNLDGLFANATIDAEQLKVLTDEIGALEAKIRFTHLKAHLDQRALLKQGQIQRYDELRGYRHQHHKGHH